MKKTMILICIVSSFSVFAKTRKQPVAMELMKVSECKLTSSSLIQYGPKEEAKYQYSSVYTYKIPVKIIYNVWEEDTSGKAIEASFREKKELAHVNGLYTNHSGDIAAQRYGDSDVGDELFTYRVCPNNRKSYDGACKKLIPKETEASEISRLEKVAKNVTNEKAKKKCEHARSEEMKIISEYKEVQSVLSADDSGREISSDKSSHSKKTTSSKSSSKQ